MTRILSYNILAGGYNVRARNARRTRQLLDMIRAAKPDVVGLVEAIDPLKKERPTVPEELAEALGMQLIAGGDLEKCAGYQTALLSRLPMISTKIHVHPVLARPLLEVCVEEENGSHLTVFLTHLSAAFNRGRAGGAIRHREMSEILRIMAPARADNIPHLLMGDFNSLAPGDTFLANALLRYILRLDEKRRLIGMKADVDGHPHLEGVVPRPLRILMPLLHMVAKQELLGGLFNLAASMYAPRSCIRLLHGSYIDCFRKMHAHAPGFTCPAEMPAGRIDYIFASSQVADRLTACQILTEGESVLGSEASDHLPIMIELGLPLQMIPSVPAHNVDDVLA